MRPDLTFVIKATSFDEGYSPSSATRLTTNFANLARGEKRQENLRNAFRMMNSRFNALANWDNPTADRYAVELEIISASLSLDTNADPFPLMEMLQPYIVDRESGKREAGIVGNNFSSYIRDYDFAILLPRHYASRAGGDAPNGFGELHGAIFKQFIASEIYRALFTKPPVICLSVSSTKTYHRTTNAHPILGVEYRQDEASATDRYFAQMGLRVRYFMPSNAVAPLAFYFTGDLLNDHTNLELIASISVMETFQRIYRPQIYNANVPAGQCFRPSLHQQDYSLPQVHYDREERNHLAQEQGRFAGEHLIAPYGHLLARWSANFNTNTKGSHHA